MRGAQALFDLLFWGVFSSKKEYSPKKVDKQKRAWYNISYKRKERSPSCITVQSDCLP